MIAGARAARHNHHVRALVVSLTIHAVVLWLVIAREDPAAPHGSPAEPHVEDRPIVVDVIVTPSSGGGGGTSVRAGIAPSGPRVQAAGEPAPVHSRVASTRAHRRRAADPWEGVSIRTDDASGTGRGTGSGDGTGSGRGNGIGFGNGGGVQVARDVPPPPVPVMPAPSQARPARLIWPNRDVEVIDDSYLFVARVTVDEDGTVVGAHMLTMRAGSRAERAADAIWQFRYDPARDEHGVPVRSTFDQSFQVR